MSYKRTLHLFFLGFFPLFLFSQTFNVAPKAYVGGMPGNVYNDIWGYVDHLGKEYAIIGSSQAINIYDVTDCANPILKMAHQDGSTVTWRDFKTYRNFAYGICDGGACSEGLEIVNLDNYTVTQNTSVFDRAHNIYIDTTFARLYVVGSNASSGQMTIYTLDTEIVSGTTYNGTPENPILIKKFATEYIHDIYVKDNIAYASHGNDGFKIWDVSDVNNITPLASHEDSQKYNHSSWMSSNSEYVYVAEELPRGRPIKIFHKTGSGISTSLNLVATFKEPLEEIIPNSSFSNNRPHNPFVKGDTLIISYYEDGVQIFDISNPLVPKRIAYYDTYKPQNGLGYDIPAHDWKGAWGVYPYLPSGCMLVADITQGLFTFKVDMPISDGLNPGKVIKIENGSYVFNSNTKGIVLRSDKGYCFRLKAESNGNISTERIVCHVNSDLYDKFEKADLAITDINYSVVLNDPNSLCKKLVIDNNQQLTSETISCIGNPTDINIMDNDSVIETYTKGLILKGFKDFCYRITVNNSGDLLVQRLNSCP